MRDRAKAGPRASTRRSARRSCSRDASGAVTRPAASNMRRAAAGADGPQPKRYSAPGMAKPVSRYRKYPTPRRRPTVTTPRAFANKPICTSPFRKGASGAPEAQAGDTAAVQRMIRTLDGGRGTGPLTIGGGAGATAGSAVISTPMLVPSVAAPARIPPATAL